MKPRTSPSLPTLAALTLVYFVAGKVGLALAFLNASASPVWPATGIALAALVVLGAGAWPAILLGAFLVNVTTAATPAASVGIAVGNALEALVGAYLVERWAGGRHMFDRARGVFLFTLLAALGSTLVSATVGVTSLSLARLVRPEDLGWVWLTWWFGDATGALVVAPAIVLWATRPRLPWISGKALEGAGLLSALFVVGLAVFGGLLPTQDRGYPLEFLCLPLLVWAAFRFGQRAAATASLLLAAIAIWGTLAGLGPFARPSRNESLLLLEAFLGVVAVTTTALAAVVAERRRVQDSLALLETAVDTALEGIFILTLDRRRGMPRITFVNDAFCRITGMKAADLLGETAAVLPLADDAGAGLRRSLDAGSRFQTDTLRLHRPEGAEIVLDLEVTPVAGDEVSPARWIGIVRDVTRQAEHLEVLEHQALYDFLTGLPNRVLMRDRLDQAIRSAGRQDASLALLVMDLDRFKDINDTFGHQFGDLLLKEFGQRLRSLLRTADTVARLGGDEFAVLLPDARAASDGALMAEKILAALEKPFVIEGQSLEVSASIGIAMCPRDGDDWTTLLRCSDVAMYAAKQSSEGYVVYAAGEDTYGVGGLTLMRELRAGVDGHELHLHYQPQVRVRDGRAAAVEALMRWQHPRRGLLLPGQFLPAAERTGVIKPLCDWAIETALDHCRQWREAGRPLNVAVNVSGRNLRDPLLSERLESLLGAARLDPACLKLEIPQDSILAEAHGASAALLRLRSTGVRVSIDDFGAAPASLASLKRLPVDEIKISGTLVREMAHDARDAAIVRCAVELAHGLGRQVVAQDVEDAASWRMLAEYGCDFAQGRYVSPVLTRAELGRWLDDSAPNAITRG